MKVLVTGANGYIASNLVKYLVQRKYQVIALEKKGSSLDKLKSIRNKIEVFKATNFFKEINGIINKTKPEVVAHLAALTIIEHSPKQIEPLVSSNILFPSLLLEAMVNNRVKYFVNTGSFWEYAKGAPNYQPLNLYAATKSGFEQILRYYEDARGIHSVTLKLYGVYGPHDPRGKIFSLFKQSACASRPVLFSPGRQKLDLVYIEDAVRAFEKAIRYVRRKKDYNEEIFFIGSGKSTELRKISGIFEKCLCKTLNIKWGGRPYRKREIMDSKADIRTARIKLNWKPKFTLRDGILSMLKAEGAI